MKTNKTAFLCFLIALSACDSAGGSDTTQPGPGLNPVLPSALPPGFVAADTQAFAVAVTWEKTPIALSLSNRAIVRFLSLDGRDTAASLLRFSLIHGTTGQSAGREEDLSFIEVEPGLWFVDFVYFSMAGGKNSWLVDVEAESAGRRGLARIVIDSEIQ